MNILDWIKFGKVSAERDDLLVKYFYDNGVLDKVIDSPSSFLILGRKGAGKTAVFKYLAENSSLHLNNKAILIPLSFENYNWNIHALLNNTEKAESLSYKQSWKFIVVIEAIKAIYKWLKENDKKIPKEIEKANKLLEKLFDSPVPSIYQIISNKLLSIATIKLPKAGLDLEDGSLDSFDVEGGEISFDQVNKNSGLRQALSENIENVLNVLERSLSTVKDVTVFVCFDKIDEAWDDVSFDSSKKVITGLVSAADSITAQYKGAVRPIIFLREDIFEVLSLNDANKLREDCGQLLHWNRETMQRLLLERVNYYATTANQFPIPSLEMIFEDREMRQRSKPFQYILKRTMMRPRDFISYLNAIIDCMNEKANDPFAEEVKKYEVIDSQAIYDAEAGYSEWLRREIIDEWAVQNPIIKDLLTALQNHGLTNFTSDQLKSQVSKLRTTLEDHEMLSHLKFMFDNSIIGFKIGESNQWKFKCFFPSQGFISSSEYRVHEGLVRGLNLKETRES